MKSHNASIICSAILALVTTSAISFGVASHSTAASEPTETKRVRSSDEVLVAQEKLRLEESFIAKMSEELKLSAEAQTSFANAIRSLNREKAKANAAVDEALTAIDKAQSVDRAKSKRETQKAIKRYESAWRTYGTLPLREVSRLRAILGAEKLGRYLVAKSLVIEKLTSLSANPAAPSK